MTKILITGANGQLGSELRNLLDERGVAYDAFDSNQMDITDQAVVNEKISALKPEVIYHCAAYTAVDNAEDVAKDLNWQVNVDGTRNVAEAAKRVGAKMVYISTDYVFDGTNEGEYEVDAPTNPRNEYGKAKLAGEKAIHIRENARIRASISARFAFICSTASICFLTSGRFRPGG